MRFAPPRRRQTSESVVPMINVVFLLLIFFMMSATIAPAPPFDLTLPTVQTDADLEAGQTLYVAADGSVSLDGQLGEAAWALLAAADDASPLTVRADAALPVVEVAQMLERLSQMGRDRVDLALRAP